MGQGYELSKPTPNAGLPPASFHFSRFYDFPQTPSPTGDRVFTHMKEISHLSHYSYCNKYLRGQLLEGKAPSFRDSSPG